MVTCSQWTQIQSQSDDVTSAWLLKLNEGMCITQVMVASSNVHSNFDLGNWYHSTANSTTLYITQN